MKHFNDKVIIGIDNGYGNIKTANHVFRAGLVKCETEPVFHGDILFYDGHYYLIGEGHKEYNPEKITDDDYFILTLAGIAMELRAERLYEATVHIAAGLPLKWVSQQKKAFTDYLLRKPDVIFEFNREIYHIRISGVSIFPQGYAAIFDKTADMKGMHVLCDIGNDEYPVYERRQTRSPKSVHRKTRYRTVRERNKDSDNGQVSREHRRISDRRRIQRRHGRDPVRMDDKDQRNIGEIR